MTQQNKSRILLTLLISFAIIALPNKSRATNLPIAPASIIGINDINLSKIPIGIINLGYLDSDGDDLDNELELAIGTNINKKDTDGDGYDDKTEIENNFNPLGIKKIKIDLNFAKKLSGKYLLQVNKNGQLWYVNPDDNKRYFVGNKNRFDKLIQKLHPIVTIKKEPNIDSDILAQAAEAIRYKDNNKLTSLCSVNASLIANYNLNYLKNNNEALFAWANIVSGAELKYATETEKTYINNFYVGFMGRKVDIVFKTSKQPDGSWLISKL
ncbi:MAG: hypothetical protein WCG01_02515 [bacterium]